MNLEKISDMIWKIVGIALACCFLLGLFAIFVSAGFGLIKYRQHRVDGVEVAEDKKEQGSLKTTIQYELPIVVEGLEHFIVPVTLQKKKVGEARESFQSEKLSSDYSSRSMSYGGYSYYGGPYYNLLFVNKKTGETRLLLKNKAYIEEIYFPDAKYDVKEAKKTTPVFLLYKIAAVDTNQDGVLNGKDALAGYVSHPDGTGLMRVTPENTQMGSWRYDGEAKALFVEVIHDLNKDKKFDWDDPKTIVSLNPLEPTVGKEVVSQETRTKVIAVLK